MDPKVAITINKSSAADSGIGAGKSSGSPVLSLFALYACSSFRKIALVLAGLVVAEGASFYMVCRRLEQSGVALYPEKMIDLCFLKYIFLAALVLVSFILLVTEGDRGGCRSSYTLLRLKVSIKRQFAARTVYNFLCLMMVFAVQMLAALAISRFYETKLPPELVSPQYLFLTFYRNEFLQCILPMADLGKWVCSLLLLLALAMDAAYIRSRNSDGNRSRNGSESRVESVEGLGRRKGMGGNFRNGFLFSVMNYVILAQWFVSGINSPAALLCALYSLAIIAIILYRLFAAKAAGGN